MTPSPDTLAALVALVGARAGTSLSSLQRARVEAALKPKLERCSADELLEVLRTPRGAADLAELMSAVSVHKTDLFRDAPQLEALALHVLPRLVRSRRPLSVWSAGCATGEEVATLLVLLEEAGAPRGSTVLGTDLSAPALEKAKSLTFGDEAMQRVPDALKARYFNHDTEARSWQLVPALAGRARFEQHNLMDSPYPTPAHGSTFDLIVCRNVLIYFVPDVTLAVVARLAERLSPEGTLVLAATEPLVDPNDAIETERVEGAYFYRRRRAGPPKPKASPQMPRPLMTPQRAAAAKVAPRESSPRPTPWDDDGPTPPVRPRMGGLPPDVPEVPTSRASAPTPRPSTPQPPPQTPREEGRRLFALTLEWAAATDSTDATVDGLRKALYLAPDLAAARYMLGLLLDRRGELEAAKHEYRRALNLIETGKADLSGSLLNAERLAQACAHRLAPR